VAEMKKRIPGREVSVDIQVEDHNIPDSFYVIHGNKELLLVAIGNVLDNAAKYSSSNALIEVILRLNKNKGNTIEINDHGVGMKQEDLFNIGQPFFRAESVKHIQGHGIGLSLVKQIMNIHNAFVDIKSVLGYGTSVHFNFPIK
jgi:signal transduction histidine kinase